MGRAKRRDTRLTPRDLLILNCVWLGMTRREVAKIAGVSPATVDEIVKSPAAERLDEQRCARTIDTMNQIQSELQAAAPVALAELQKIAFDPTSTVRERRQAAQYLVDAAGHKAKSRVEIQRGDPIDDRYRGKSETEIRAEMEKELTALRAETPPPDEKTVH